MNGHSKFRCFVLALLVLLIDLHIKNVQGAGVQLKYIEDDVEIINATATQTGSYADLGVYSHWCVGAIGLCYNGVSVHMKIKPKSLPESTPSVVLLTNGGYTANSNGVYLIQRFGDQYEFGIAVKYNRWKVNFRLTANVWTRIWATWSMSDGLSVHIDYHSLKNKSPEFRQYEKQTFASFSNVVVGLDGMGNPIKDKKLFEIKEISFLNKVLSESDVQADINMYYIGCDNSQNLESGNEINKSSSIDPVSQCRQHCFDMDYSAAGLQDSFICRCGILSKVTKSISQECEFPDAWQIFTVTSVNMHHPYIINVTIDSLQVRNYVKPYETVMIIARSNLAVNTTFVYDLGDGYTISTAAKQIGHYWTKEGTYTVSLETTIGEIKLNDEVTFTVEDRDEGVPPEMVIIDGFYSEKQMYGEFNLIVLDEAETQCSVNLGDGSDTIIPQIQQGFFAQNLIQHSFPSFGQYIVNASCGNRYGTTKFEEPFLSKKSDIPFLYYPYDSNFFIEVAGDESFISSVNVTRNFERESLYFERESNGIDLNSDYLLPFENIIALKSSENVFLQRIFHVQTMLENATIIPYQLSNAWNMTTNISFLIPPGNNIFLKCSVGIDDDMEFYVYESNMTLELVIEANYLELGYYTIGMTVSNDKSFLNVEDLISVEVPIVSISLSTNNITDKTKPVELVVNLNEGETGPERVRFEIRRDDGILDHIGYVSRTYRFTPYVDKHVYKNWGIYTICVTARNSLSQQSSCILVQVGQNITHIDLQTTTTARVTTTAAAEVNITSDSGTDKTYTINFDDNTNFVFKDKKLKYNGDVFPIPRLQGTMEENARNDSTNNENTESTINDANMTTNMATTTATYSNTSIPSLEVPRGYSRSSAIRISANTITVKHVYNTPGTYRVTATVKNAFSYAETELCPSVIVDDTDISSCTSPVITFQNIQSSYANPLRRIRSEEFNITVDGSSNCGNGEFQYSWKATKFHGIQEKPISEICTPDNSSDVLVIPALSLAYGLYKITVTASPQEYSRLASTADVYLSIDPSNPYAEIAGGEEVSFLIYENAIINMRSSRDPDLETDNKQGLQYDLFCFPRSEFEIVDSKPLKTLKQQSSLLYHNFMFSGEYINRFKFYQYDNCFINLNNMTADTSIIDGNLLFPAEYFTVDESEFTFKLFVSKEGRINSTIQHVQIKLTNSSDEMDQLNAMSKIEDCGTFIRAANLFTGKALKSDDNSTEASEKQTEMREKLSELADNLAGIERSSNEVKGMISLVGTINENADQASSKSRISGSSAVKKSVGNMQTKFRGSAFDSVKDVSSSALNSVDNLTPDSTNTENAPRKRREVPQGEEETSDLPEDSEYNMLLKNEGQGAPHSPYLYKFYEYIIYNNKAFRAAVRQFGTQMWLPQSYLKIDKVDLFIYIAIRWDPFDIEEYINFYCEIKKKEHDEEALIANKNVANDGEGSLSNMGSLLIDKMDEARRKRRKRSVQGNDTGSDMSYEGDQVPTTLAISSAKMDMLLDVKDPNDPGPTNINSDKGGVQIPNNGEAGGGTSVVANGKNPFSYCKGGGDIKSNTISIKSLDIGSGSSKEKKMENLEKPLRITIAPAKEDNSAPQVVELCKPNSASASDSTHWEFRDFIEEGYNKTFHLIVKPLDPATKAEFVVYFQSGMRPNTTHFIFKTSIPRRNENFISVTEGRVREELKYTAFPPEGMTKKNGSYSFGIALKQSVINHEKPVTCVNFTMKLLITSCKFFNKTTERFESNGCYVGNQTTKWETECFCNHLTTFGGDVAVPPNTIDFSNVWAKFKNLSENAAVFSTVITLIGIYIILLIWARHMDKKDLIKWGATPLQDNLPSDNYHYQITVQTGMRKKAGTKSKISFILSGENCDSGVRRLYDGHREVLSRGSIFNYICSVENPLGQLTFMRIWHDNSGKGKHKGWFLDQVQVNDLQTGDRYIFLCDQWLALEEDDGMVDRILPVAGLEDLAAFKQLFSANIRKKLTNEHLWFSVFSRPTKSNFTRAQRISCCMSLLFMTMITNAMWFKSDERENQSQALKVGPVSFTMQQLFVSFASTMLVFPVNFILMTFFRKCRPKKNAILQNNQQMPKRGKWKNVTNGSQIWGNSTKRSKWKRFKDSVENILNFHQRSKYGTEDLNEEEDKPKTRIVGVPEDEKKKPKRKKKPGTLPHWCIYIAWGLCFLSILTSGFFTILYSMEWGKEKANEWLTTFLMSFFQSVIVVQPVKVMCIVAFIACILKKPSIDEEDVNEDLNNVIAAHDEEFLRKDNDTINDIAERRKQANQEFQPPDPSTLEAARQQRIMELKMEEVVKEIFIYAIFVLILFFLSYQNRDSDSYTYAANLKSIFFNGFDKITTGDQYWQWMESKFIPALYATEFKNGTKIEKWWEKRCILDLESRRVGIPRLRQLRVKPDTCKVHPLMSTAIKHCRDEYGWSDDDTKPYLPGWEIPSEENATALREMEKPTPWVYQNSVKLRNAPYMATIATYKGGGYVAMFEREVVRNKAMLEELKQKVWLDTHTRAVFMEFTVYNPNVNLFGSVIMVIEYMSSGGAVPRSEVKVFRLLSYIGGLGILVLIFEAIYACFTLYFFIRCIRKVKKERAKYFKQFWNQLEFGLLCFCVSVIAMYAFKQILTSVAMDALKDAEKADYVNFQSLALYDELYGYMIGIVVFVATIQFLKLLQFNKKMSMLGDTVKLAAKDLKVFTIAFVLYFLAFTITGFLLFSPYMVSYSNFVGSAESMFAFTLGSFDFVAMTEAHPVLGPAFFFLFIAVIYVGLMSIFLTIIADAFSEVKENCTDATNEYEIVDYMMKRVKGIMGIA